jgi:glucose/arabinose dehydrogenase/mono/diheme cytochrome c family protein
MKNKFWILGMLAFSMLVYTCTVSKNTASKSTATGSVNPRPAFNPNPSADYLSAQESMKHFNLPKGYHIELVASEPMVKEPVAIAWDGDARMYVVELLTYMQDADAVGEQEPRSRISLLEDTNGDGKMDKSSVFIDNLLLPRMILCINHELIVNETNTITMTAYKDTDGDGKADSKRVLYQNPTYKNSSNMEHQRSGLDWNLDNWIYMTYENVRFRYKDGLMKPDTMINGAGGQWGLTHDNYGRLFYSSAGGEVPVVRFQINPVYGSLEFPDQISDEFMQVWPVMATPDVQGGLPRLRPDSTLNHFTASNGQSIYRGNTLPQNLTGDYIVCEPVGRLVRRAKVMNLKGKTTMQNAYYRQEFISSSDIYFRPVNSYTGPDGNLYIVDMYRGIIQQGTWTPKDSYLRRAIDRRGMAKNIGRGRIYRVVYDGMKPGPKPHMLDVPASKLVTYLDHPNGWWRDNAQKQIILLGDKSVTPALKQIASGQQATLSAKPSALARIHALWTLEGLESIDKDILTTALKDPDAEVRKTAVWISEMFIKRNDAQMINQLGELKNDPSYDVRIQLVLSLYSNKTDNAKAIVKYIVDNNQDNEMLNGAAPAKNVSVMASLERTENIRTYGARLGMLPAASRSLVLEGATTFRSLCATCHGADAKGIAAGVAPPLVGSKRLTADKVLAIRIVLHGLQGPVDGKSYPGDLMPAQGANNDQWIASVLSYARFEFGGAAFRGNNAGTPFITAEDVKKVREATASRNKPWTIAELEAIPVH